MSHPPVLMLIWYRFGGPAKRGPTQTIWSYSRNKMQNDDSEDPYQYLMLDFLPRPPPPPLTTNTISFLFRVCTRFKFYIFSRKKKKRKKERYKLSNGPRFPAHRMLPPPRTSPPLRQPDQVHLPMPDLRPRPPGPRRPAAPQPEKSRLARGFPEQWEPTIF